MGEAAAVKLIVDCHSALGDLDKALEAALGGKADVAKKGDNEALTEAWQTVVNAHCAKGEFSEAVTAATEATKVKDSKCEASARLLLATALTRKAAQEEEKDVAMKGFKEAAEAQKKAAALYKELDL